MQVTTIGLDIAKNVFQVHGIDTAEKVVVRRQVRSSQVLEFFKVLPACLVGMEAGAARPSLSNPSRIFPRKLPGCCACSSPPSCASNSSIRGLARLSASSWMPSQSTRSPWLQTLAIHDVQ
jgi:hypothetical protein